MEKLNFLLTKAFRSKHRYLPLETSLPLPFIALALSQAVHLKREVDEGSNQEAQSQISNLILTLNERQSQELLTFLRFFAPHIKPFLLPTPEKISQPSALQQKCAWLYAAQNPQPQQIFIASVQALMEKTPSPALFDAHCVTIQKGDLLGENLDEIFVSRGYESAPLVEYPGQYALRGSIVDFFPPHQSLPCRIERFGDQVEALWQFLPQKQRNWKALESASILPCNPFFYQTSQSWRQKGCERIQESLRKRELYLGYLREDLPYILSCLRKGIPFQGIELLMDYFFQDLQSPLSFFKKPLNLWALYEEEQEIQEQVQSFLEELQPQETDKDKIDKDKKEGAFPLRRISLFFSFEETMALLDKQKFSKYLHISSFHMKEHLSYSCSSLKQKLQQLHAFPFASSAWTDRLQKRLEEWKKEDFKIFICCSSVLSLQFMERELQTLGLKAQRVQESPFFWETYLHLQEDNPSFLHLLPQSLNLSFALEEDKILFIAEKDLWSKKASSPSPSSASSASVSSFGSGSDSGPHSGSGSVSGSVSPSVSSFPAPVSVPSPLASTINLSSKPRDAFASYKKMQSLSFADIEPSSFVVHIQHGIGQYMGLKEISLTQGVRSEFIEIHYRNHEKLYLPVYKLEQLQKYRGDSHPPLDKLGGQNWNKKKLKVRQRLREIAGDLLALYTQRKKIERAPFKIQEREYLQFATQFPYTETKEQQQSIQEILHDMLKEKTPMDRLVCGDVGFGKTEVALRACFVALANHKQVAILCPTTLLSFQHFETLKDRFRSWPFPVVCFNRFISSKQISQNKADLKTGKASIAIGTHRLLSRDLEFHNLGLIIIDEEHKFGVRHKEKLRQIKHHVDTLALSATPIPRTFNMSLVGIRNLSLIHTPPQNRLPIKTMSVPFQTESLRKIVQDELSRGGQIFFIHNRVHTIELVAQELKQMLEGMNVRLAIAHGQQSEKNLEETMLQFLNKKIDLLVSTNIVESGMDLPNVNTLLIHKPEQIGLSQMYQLRGRVGRSSRQAYCYFLLPPQRKISPALKERLSILQQNTRLGSGLTLAQYDMELRGTGNLLGEEQSGHLNAVGYELYMDLLKESLSELKGEKQPAEALQPDPDIVVPLPALIPHEYMSDIRPRLHYYKRLASARDREELEDIQREIQDQFGYALPPELENLCLLMLIKNLCKKIGVQHLKMGRQNLLLGFMPKESAFIKNLLQLVQEKKRYQLKPPNQLAIELKEVSWMAIYKALDFLYHRLSVDVDAD